MAQIEILEGDYVTRFDLEKPVKVLQVCGSELKTEIGWLFRSTCNKVIPYKVETPKDNISLD